MFAVKVVLRVDVKLVCMHVSNCDAFCAVRGEFPNMFEIGVVNVPLGVHHDADTGMSESWGSTRQQEKKIGLFMVWTSWSHHILKVRYLKSTDGLNEKQAFECTRNFKFLRVQTYGNSASEYVNISSISFENSRLILKARGRLGSYFSVSIALTV